MKARFTQEQIIGLLKQHEAGVSTAQLCRDNNVSAASLYKWKAKYGGMSFDDSRRLKQLEDENSKLKRIVADLTLDNVVLKDVLSKNW
jgi:putative transposase